jgi:hypothetical protein
MRDRWNPVSFEELQIKYQLLLAENRLLKKIMSLFKSRDDVSAKKWDGKKKGSAGYPPVCLNEWRPGVCG